MSHNTLIHLLVRPAVRLTARTRITPNHLTTARLATGVAAAAAFARGSYGWMSIGAAIFLLSMLLDRADGELARQTGQASAGGHRYDLICDFIASTMAFVGLGVGVAATVGAIGLWLGLLAAFGVGVLFYQINIQHIASAYGREVMGGRATIDPDDAMIAAPLLIWCGLAWPVVIAAAVITPAAALIIALTDRRNVAAED